MIQIAWTVYVVMFVMQSKLWGWEGVVSGFAVYEYLRDETPHRWKGVVRVEEGRRRERGADGQAHFQR